jgi:hypothetical protein
MAQDERRGFEIVDDFPFMLRHSKHSEPFFNSLLIDCTDELIALNWRR